MLDWLVVAVVAVVGAFGLWLLAFGDVSRLGIAGVLLGAVVGFLVSHLNERRKQRYEDSHRWESERRAAYVRLLEEAARHKSALRARHEVAARNYLAGGMDLALPPRADQSALRALLDEIEILGTWRVHARAEELCNWLGDDFEGPDSLADVPWSAFEKEIGEAREKFIRAAKVDLGIPSPPPRRPLAVRAARRGVRFVRRRILPRPPID